MIRSEIVNVRSTATGYLLLVGSMVMAAVSLLANLATFDASELSQKATIEQAMHSSTVATITFAFLAGLVSATSDYRFGRMDQLLLGQPRPTAVLMAKSAVGFALGLVYGLAGSAVAVAVISVYYERNDAVIDLTASIVVRPLLGVVVAGGLFAIFGIGVGTAIRNQPVAIAGGLAFLLIVQPPMLLGAPDIGRWLPGAAGLSMTLAPDPALVGQGVGGVIMLGWTILAIVIGDARLKRIGA